MATIYMKLFLATLLLGFFSFQTSQAQLRTGLDMVIDFRINELKNKRIALLTNKSGVDRFGASNYYVLKENGVNIKRIFSPEHGFFVNKQAGQKITQSSSLNNIDIVSLYGDRRKPTKDHLSDLDMVIFDIQDIGTRCYTYISSMKLMMEACQEHQVAFAVLDRPNPISPIKPQGFMLEPDFQSFVGLVNLPFVHGMTVGEIATFLQATEFQKLNLKVFKMHGWKRTKFYDDQFTWINDFFPPSPNIKDVETQIAYPATVFLEASNISEGRGTDSPFLKFGAPFINARDLAFYLRILNLEGVHFIEVTFTPKAIVGKAENPKYKGEKCHGLQLKITNRETFNPFEVGVAILTVLQRLYPKEFNLLASGSFIDYLAGTDQLRKMVRSGKDYKTIVKAAQQTIQPFLEQRKDYLLYP
jgi:uncharacterized protein YbbC (DUF1343 family)